MLVEVVDLFLEPYSNLKTRLDNEIWLKWFVNVPRACHIVFFIASSIFVGWGSLLAVFSILVVWCGFCWFFIVIVVAVDNPKDSNNQT